MVLLLLQKPETRIGLGYMYIVIYYDISTIDDYKIASICSYIYSWKLRLSINGQSEFWQKSVYNSIN